LFAIAVFTVSLSLPAEAQYPPPTPTPTATSTATGSPVATSTPRASACAITGVLTKRGNKVRFTARSEFTPGSKIAVRGGRRCARKKLRVRISIDIDGESTSIGVGKSNENGAYTVRGKIPNATSFGRHAIFVNTKGKSYVTDIDVVPASGARDSGFAGAGPMLATWVALAGIIAAFLVATRRRRARPAAVFEGSDRGVPMLDTWDFVPVLPKRRRGGRTPAKKKLTGPAAGTRKKAKPKSKPKASTPKAVKSTSKSKAKSKAKPKAAPKAKPKPGARASGSRSQEQRAPKRGTVKPKPPGTGEKKSD
jgi:hypothetical protein